MEIRDAIKYSRKKANLTQQQLAERIGLKRSTIGRYENGDNEPSVDIINKISSVVNVDILKMLSTFNYFENHEKVLANMPETLCEYMAYFNGYDFRSFYDNQLEQTVYVVTVSDKEIPILSDYFAKEFLNPVIGGYANYEFHNLLNEIIASQSETEQED